MPPPAHVSVIRTLFRTLESQMRVFTRSDPVGAVLPASDLVAVLKKHCHVVICQRRIRCFATWSGVCSHWFSTLHRPNPSVSSCSGTLYDQPLCSSNTFSDRRLALSRTIRSLRACRLCLSLPLLFGCTPICVGTGLLSSVLLCFS